MENKELSVTGKVVKMMPLQEIQGKNGQLFKQEFVIETAEQYPKQICISAWNDLANIVQKVPMGSTVTVGINIESREYNDRWYTDVKAWKINVADASAQTTQQEQPF